MSKSVTQSSDLSAIAGKILNLEPKNSQSCLLGFMVNSLSDRVTKLENELNESNQKLESYIKRFHAVSNVLSQFGQGLIEESTEERGL